MRILGHGRYARETYPESGGGGATASLAREWSEVVNALPVSSAGSINLATVTITPNVTGKFRVIVTGRVDDQSGSQNGWQMYIGHGETDPVTPDYSLTSSSNFLLSANGELTFSVVVDLDKVGVTFPVGTPVQIGVAGGTTSGTGVIPSSGLQLEVQEVF